MKGTDRKKTKTRFERIKTESNQTKPTDNLELKNQTKPNSSFTLIGYQIRSTPDGPVLNSE